jgi:ketosteroid isomerase-like protein
MDSYPITVFKKLQRREMNMLKFAFKTFRSIFFLTVSFFCMLPALTVQAQKPDDLIIAKERAALDRWKTGDTFGFIDIAADDITYFDPGLEERCGGIKAFRNHLASFKGTFSFPGYELLNPNVQLYGDMGVLTFNFVGTSKDGKRDRWNTTEVYRLVNGDWKLVSSHWSHTKPKIQSVE